VGRKKMNLYKSRILKSEEVKIIKPPHRQGGKEGADGDCSAPSLSTASDPVAAIEEAYQQGFADGKGQGGKEARRELADVIRLFKDLTAHVARFRTDLLAAAEKDVVTLSLALAEKILHQELTLNRSAVTAIFRAALEAFGEQEKMQVKCHPADLETLSAYLADLKASQGGFEQVEFVADPSLSPGGVKVESSLCEVDASLETRLATLKNVLFS